MPATSPPTDLTLYSAVACNYAQRTRIASAIKGTKYDLVEVDLLDRPADFMATPSRGTVPALAWDGGFVYGSSTLNEFIEEQWPDPPLLPDDVLQRAEARSWVSLNHDKVSRPFEAALMVVDEDRTEPVLRDFDALLVDLDARLRVHWSDDTLAFGTGPYWHGDLDGPRRCHVRAALRALLRPRAVPRVVAARGTSTFSARGSRPSSTIPSSSTRADRKTRCSTSSRATARTTGGWPRAVEPTRRHPAHRSRTRREQRHRDRDPAPPRARRARRRGARAAASRP